MDQTDQGSFGPYTSQHESRQNHRPNHDEQNDRQQSAPGPSTETFRVSGDAVLAKVKELVREGNVRRIVLKNEQGRTLLDIPLTVGVVGVLLLPVWTAIGAVAALVANLTITVERRERQRQTPQQNSSVSVDKNSESTR